MIREKSTIKERNAIDQLTKEFQEDNNISPERQLYYGKRAYELGIAPYGINDDGTVIIRKESTVDREISKLINIITRNGIKYKDASQGFSKYEIFQGVEPNITLVKNASTDVKGPASPYNQLRIALQEAIADTQFSRTDKAKWTAAYEAACTSNNRYYSTITIPWTSDQPASVRTSIWQQVTKAMEKYKPIIPSRTR